jgi:transposase
LAKNGNAHLRKALYMPAVVAQRWNPLMKALSVRMQATGHSPMQIIGAIMRKLLHLAYGVIKTGKPFDPKHALALTP